MTNIFLFCIGQKKFVKCSISVAAKKRENFDESIFFIDFESLWSGKLARIEHKIIIIGKYYMIQESNASSM